MAGVPLYVLVAKIAEEFLEKNRASIDEALKALRPEKLDFGK